MTDLASRLQRGAFEAYAYSYPHKNAYRALPPRTKARVWADEDRVALFLYSHVPFCEMRCGFCNLFTEAVPEGDRVDAYLDTLEREARIMAEALGPDRGFARSALGGGTPTLLEPRALERLLGIHRELGADPRQTDLSVEASPRTLTSERLSVLEAAGTYRVSMGVQSVFPDELKAIGRPQQAAILDAALDLLQATTIPIVNLDLIYGIPGQTEASLVASIDAVLARNPREIFLYPLYVRPGTGLGRRGTLAEERLRLYRAGRDHLRSLGWVQRSMRMFQAPDAPGGVALPYSCQQDGMVGLGVGARSYTRGLHYSSRYAVSRKAVMDITTAYIARDDEALAQVTWGIVLDEDEQRRRWVIQSLLNDAGLDHAAYASRFGSSLPGDFPELRELHDLGLAADIAGVTVLTDAGFEVADVLGPWLQSDAVGARIAEAVVA